MTTIAYFPVIYWQEHYWLSRYWQISRKEVFALAESTVTKSKVFKEDLNLATGGTGAAEQGTRQTSTGGTVTLTKLDASHLKFRAVSASVDDLVDGGNDVDVGVNDLTAAGDVVLSAMTTAGFVKNDANGALTGGANIVDSADDLPPGIDASKLADGSVSNTEFQYLNGVTSAIQDQIDAIAPASQANQEAGSEAAKYVAPATQQFHPSAAKAWLYATVSGGTPTLQASYNIASITDNGVGLLTATWDTDFSSVNYCAHCTLGGEANWHLGGMVTTANMARGRPSLAVSRSEIILILKAGVSARMETNDE